MRPFTKRVLIAIATFVFLWVGGLGVFIFAIPEQVHDETTETQAIVVLTGGRERLKTGFQLLCSNRAKTIFISGVHREETLKSLLKAFESSNPACLLNREELAAVTHLGYAARNTKENAEEASAWVKQASIPSFRLVTAAYHMPRSFLEFTHQLPHTTIILHPVFPNGFNRSHWWQMGTFYLILSEYHKFLWAFVRIYFSMIFKAPPKK